MKKILFLMAIAITIQFAAKAQQYLDLTNNTCTDLLIRAVAGCHDYCPNQYVYFTSVPAHSHVKIISPVPGSGSILTWDQGNNPQCSDWEWLYVEYSQACSNSNGTSTGCPYDLNGVGDMNLVCSEPYNNMSCIELSSSCGTCTHGTIINATFLSGFSGWPPTSGNYLGASVVFN